MVTRKVARPVAPVRDDTGEEAIHGVPANPLIDDSLAQTLENAKAVIWFIRDWNARTRTSEETDEANLGFDLVLAMVDGALEYVSVSISGEAA